MSLVTTVFSMDPVVVDGMSFRLDFDHWDNEGYQVTVTPWATNGDKNAPEESLVLMGASDNPGMQTRSVDAIKRRYGGLAEAEALKVKAIYMAAGLIAACMKAYGKNLSITHAAVLSQMEGVDVDLLNQVAQSYWPDCPPPVG